MDVGAHGGGPFDLVVLNVNVPNQSASRRAGTLFTSLANTSCLTRYRFCADAHTENALSVIPDDAGELPAEPWTDAWALALGYVAITPLQTIPDLLCVVSWAASPEAIALSTFSGLEIAGQIKKP